MGLLPWASPLRERRQGETREKSDLRGAVERGRGEGVKGKSRLANASQGANR